MKKLTFKFDAESSLEVLFVNFQWWFNLESFAQILRVKSTKDFVRQSRSANGQIVDGTAVCNLKEFCQRLFASRQPSAKDTKDWFFDEVLPQLQEFEVQDPFSPITTRLDTLEAKTRENSLNVDAWGEILSDKLAELTKEVKFCQEQQKLWQEQLKVPHKSSSNGTDYLTRLKEQQRFNGQIIDNFIQSLEKHSPPSINSSITPFSEGINLFSEEELKEYPQIINGKGNGNGWQKPTANE